MGEVYGRLAKGDNKLWLDFLRQEADCLPEHMYDVAKVIQAILCVIIPLLFMCVEMSPGGD